MQSWISILNRSCSTISIAALCPDLTCVLFWTWAIIDIERALHFGSVLNKQFDWLRGRFLPSLTTVYLEFCGWNPKSVTWKVYICWLWHHKPIVGDLDLDFYFKVQNKPNIVIFFFVRNILSLSLGWGQIDLYFPSVPWESIFPSGPLALQEIYTLPQTFRKTTVYVYRLYSFKKSQYLQYIRSTAEQAFNIVLEDPHLDQQI